MLSIFKDVSVGTEIVLSVIAYSFCSGTLVLVNKLILHFLPFPSLVITFQLWATLLFIITAQALKFLTVDPIRWKYVVPYLAYTVAFSLGVYCNMKSLQTSNVETVIVFRALAPCIVALLDSMFLGRELPSARSWTALVTILFGALGYASFDPKFKIQGMTAYLWPTAYLVAISFEMAYGKIITRSVDLKTRSGPVLYTNLLGWPPMLLFAKLGGEYDRFWTDVLMKEESKFPPGSVALLLLGCVIGTAIGYSSWWCRDKVSATSFTLIGVMNKCATVLLNLMIWDQHAPPMGVASLLLCLVGGSLYQQSPMRTVSKVGEKKNLIPSDEGVWDDDMLSVIGDEDTESATSLSPPTTAVLVPADKSAVHRRGN